MRPTRRRFNFLWAVPPALAVLAASPDASAARTLQDYRYFRALSIDLEGRMPTLDEVNAFEKDDFNVEAWIDARLSEEGYAERVRRVYMDLMRLEVGNSFRFVPGLTTLRRKTIVGPDGNPLHVYFREGQRRQRPETDNTFCLTPDETGFNTFPKNIEPTGPGKPITQAILDQYTKVVKPWWLYSDYKKASPTDLYDPATWAQKFPGFVPVPELYSIGGQAITSIRVCKE